MRRMIVLIVVVAAGLAAMGCNGGGFRATRDFSLALPWEDYQQIVVHSRNGRVELSVAGGEEIRIDGEMHVRGVTPAEAETNLDQLTIIAEADGANPGTFLVELRVPESLRRKSPGAYFVIQLPEWCAAKVDSSNGAIRAVGLKGHIVLDTSNGAIRVEDIDGDVQADSSNGRVVARHVTGDLAVQTSNGAIVAEDIGGECDLTTRNGRVEVTDARGDVTVRTSNGRIRVDATPPNAGTVILRTSNGSIHAMLPAEMTAKVGLTTSHGTIDVEAGDVPLNVLRLSRRHFQAAMNGGGGGRIIADTSNGSITLRFR